MLLIATLGIAATLLAYAISPGVRHAVGHAAHSVKHAVSHVLDHDSNENEHAKPKNEHAKPTNGTPSRRRCKRHVH